jgi:hypothetical protein
MFYFLTRRFGVESDRGPDALSSSKANPANEKRAASAEKSKSGEDFMLHINTATATAPCSQSMDTR